MKHTPGPWIATPEEIVVVEESGRMVCDLRKSPFINAIPYNSLLIAAVPDLLIAIRGALAALSQNKTFPADIEVAKTFLQNAIAKVEGK